MSIKASSRIVEVQRFDIYVVEMLNGYAGRRLKLGGLRV